MALWQETEAQTRRVPEDVGDLPVWEDRELMLFERDVLRQIGLINAGACRSRWAPKGPRTDSRSSRRWSGRARPALAGARRQPPRRHDRLRAGLARLRAPVRERGRHQSTGPPTSARAAGLAIRRPPPGGGAERQGVVIRLAATQESAGRRPVGGALRRVQGMGLPTSELTLVALGVQGDAPSIALRPSLSIRSTCGGRSQGARVPRGMATTCFVARTSYGESVAWLQTCSGAPPVQTWANSLPALQASSRVIRH